MRAGTVASTGNRNWEPLPQWLPSRRFSRSRAIAVGMENATIAANGFRKPLHGEIKLPSMSDRLYRERVDQHLRIGMRAIELLLANRAEQLHGLKLRSVAEVAFQSAG
jgi:AMP nucleosidase